MGSALDLAIASRSYQHSLNLFNAGLAGPHPPLAGAEVESRSKKQRMDEQLENRLRFLRKANTEGMPHSDRGLFDHLLGTRQLLVEWGSRPALCDAGLFHSIYSTEHYEQTAVPLTRRDEVRQLIGEIGRAHV